MNKNVYVKTQVPGSSWWNPKFTYEIATIVAERHREQKDDEGFTYDSYTYLVKFLDGSGGEVSGDDVFESNNGNKKLVNLND